MLTPVSNVHVLTVGVLAPPREALPLPGTPLLAAGDEPNPYGVDDVDVESLETDGIMTWPVSTGDGTTPRPGPPFRRIYRPEYGPVVSAGVVGRVRYVTGQCISANSSTSPWGCPLEFDANCGTFGPVPRRPVSGGVVPTAPLAADQGSLPHLTVAHPDVPRQ